MTVFKKEFWAIACAIALLFNLLAPAFAQDDSAALAAVGAQGAFGQITAISTGSISILPRDLGVPRTYKFIPDTVFLINNKKTTYDKLQVGQHAVVTSADGITTSVINEYKRPKPNIGAFIAVNLVLIGALILITNASKPPKLPALPTNPRP